MILASSDIPVDLHISAHPEYIRQAQYAPVEGEHHLGFRTDTNFTIGREREDR
jgi:hypothetical protein